ncbi:MAG: hypothetical protein JOY93_01740 [Acidobacteriales bacterium]|nr:hypothetical protein [Terriglobales bacterium]
MLRSISLEQLPASADAGWILGTATAIFRVPGAGPNETDASSSASLVVDVRDGLLPHLTLPSTLGPLHIRHFTGRLVFHDSKFEIQDGKLQAPGMLYQVRGYVWPGHMLNVNLEPAVGRRFTIRGTLTQPKILSDPNVETEAQLKP